MLISDEELLVCELSDQLLVSSPKFRVSRGRGPWRTHVLAANMIVFYEHQSTIRGLPEGYAEENFHFRLIEIDHRGVRAYDKTIPGKEFIEAAMKNHPEDNIGPSNVVRVRSVRVKPSLRRLIILYSVRRSLLVTVGFYVLEVGFSSTGCFGERDMTLCGGNGLFAYRKETAYSRRVMYTMSRYCYIIDISDSLNVKFLLCCEKIVQG